MPGSPGCTHSRAMHRHVQRRSHIPPALRRALAGTGLGLCVLLLTGCLQERASFSFGVSTSEIVGQIGIDEPETSGPPLALVYKYHYQFVEFGQGTDPAHPSQDLTHPGEDITRPTASLAYIAGDGSFSISVPVDVIAVEVFFIAPDRLTDLFQFRKQVGMGRIVYRPKLLRMPNWRSHFYTYLAPELEHVIVESRYGLPSQDQEQLSQWLTAQRKRLEAGRKAPDS